VVVVVVVVVLPLPLLLSLLVLVVLVVVLVVLLKHGTRVFSKPLPLKVGRKPKRKVGEYLLSVEPQDLQ
jgi:hypothetical protein